MKEKPKVYFSKIVSPEKIIELYNKLDIKLEGNIAIKIHSGEKGNQNFIRPEFFKPIVDLLDGTIVETNTSGLKMEILKEQHMKNIKKYWKNMDGQKYLKK